MPATPARCALCEDGTHQTYPTRTLPDGRKVRVRVCPCGAVKELAPAQTPGLCCPACGDVRMLCYDSRPRRGGAVRKRRCHHCGHQVQTVERVTSARV